MIHRFSADRSVQIAVIAIIILGVGIAVDGGLTGFFAGLNGGAAPGEDTGVDAVAAANADLQQQVDRAFSTAAGQEEQMLQAAEAAIENRQNIVDTVLPRRSMQMTQHLDQQMRNVQFARKFFQDKNRDSSDFEKGVALAKEGTRFQAESLGIEANRQVETPNHDLPSEALHALAERYDTELSSSEQEAVAELDSMEEPLPRELVDVVNAFLAFDMATQNAYADADADMIQRFQNVRNWYESQLNGSDHSQEELETLHQEYRSRLQSAGFTADAASDLGVLLREADVDLSLVFSARNQLLEETREFKAAVDASTLNSPTACKDYIFCIDMNSADNTYTTDYIFQLDLGGNDLYNNTAGGRKYNSLSSAAALIDLGSGQDTYGEPGRGRGINGGADGSGVIAPGTGFLLDGGGSDTYRGKSKGVNGGGHSLGVGFLLDMGGSDSYTSVDDGVNGGGDYGTGFLLDMGDGSDSYVTEEGWNSGDQGVNGGGNYGTGFLLDMGGSDSYTADDRGVNGGAYVGTGFLLDGGGDDVYSADYRSVNGGGRLGAGFLLDAGGSDSYTGTRYGVNGGGYLGVGVLLDVSGGDTYDAEANGVNGGASTGIGLLLDGTGQDSYTDAETDCVDCSVIPKGVIGAQIDATTSTEVFRDSFSWCNSESCDLDNANPEVVRPGVEFSYVTGDDWVADENVQGSPADGVDGALRVPVKGSVEDVEDPGGWNMVEDFNRSTGNPLNEYSQHHVPIEAGGEQEISPVTVLPVEEAANTFTPSAVLLPEKWREPLTSREMNWDEDATTINHGDGPCNGEAWQFDGGGTRQVVSEPMHVAPGDVILFELETSMVHYVIDFSQQDWWSNYKKNCDPPWREEGIYLQMKQPGTAVGAAETNVTLTGYWRTIGYYNTDQDLQQYSATVPDTVEGDVRFRFIQSVHGYENDNWALFDTSLQHYPYDWNAVTPYQWHTVEQETTIAYDDGPCNGEAWQFTGDGGGNGARYVTTEPQVVTADDTINFTLVKGDDSGSCDEPGGGDGITLQYSVDEGVTWTDIEYYESGGEKQADIPVEGRANVRFRFIQKDHGGNGYDNWALDNVTIFTASVDEDQPVPPDIAGFNALQVTPQSGQQAAVISNDNKADPRIEPGDTFTCWIKRPAFSPSRTATLGVTTSTVPSMCLWGNENAGGLHGYGIGFNGGAHGIVNQPPLALVRIDRPVTWDGILYGDEYGREILDGAILPPAQPSETESVQQWYRAVVTWMETGHMFASIQTADGTTVATLSSDDSTYTGDNLGSYTAEYPPESRQRRPTASTGFETRRTSKQLTLELTLPGGAESLYALRFDYKTSGVNQLLDFDVHSEIRTDGGAPLESTRETAEEVRRDLIGNVGGQHITDCINPMYQSTEQGGEWQRFSPINTFTTREGFAESFLPSLGVTGVPPDDTPSAEDLAEDVFAALQADNTENDTAQVNEFDIGKTECSLLTGGTHRLTFTYTQAGNTGEDNGGFLDRVQVSKLPVDYSEVVQ